MDRHLVHPLGEALLDLATSVLGLAAQEMRLKRGMPLEGSGGVQVADDAYGGNECRRHQDEPGAATVHGMRGGDRFRYEVSEREARQQDREPRKARPPPARHDDGQCTKRRHALMKLAVRRAVRASITAPISGTRTMQAPVASARLRTGEMRVSTSGLNAARTAHTNATVAAAKWSSVTATDSGKATAGVPTANERQTEPTTKGAYPSTRERTRRGNTGEDRRAHRPRPRFGPGG